MTAKLHQREPVANGSEGQKWPLQILTFVIIGTGVVVVWLAWLSYAGFSMQRSDIERSVRMEALVERFRNLDALLTMSARLEVVTAEPVWADRYRQLRLEFAMAVEQAHTSAAFARSSAAHATVVQIAAAEEQLGAVREQAMQLAQAGRAQKALGLLTSDRYLQRRRAYAEARSSFADLARDVDRARHQARRRDAVLRSVGLIIVVAIVVVAWWRAVSTARSWRGELLRTNADLVRRAQELRELNQTMERKVAERTQQLQRSNAELEQFAYVASHDLREPLRMVSSYLQLIERTYADKLDDTGRKYIFYAVDGARRMQSMIKDLLTYSRSGGRSTLGPIDCGEVMATVRRSLSVALLAAEAQLTVGPMPVVWGAAQQLTQLFQNLVDNAIKFRGTKPPEIEVTAEAEDEAWRFTVRDNGIGVDEPYREKVFLLFQRLHGRDAYPGSGIGLAVAKKIVEGHGGRIWIAATPGPGSGPEPAAAPTEGACVCFTISRAVSVGAAV